MRNFGAAVERLTARGILSRHERVTTRAELGYPRACVPVGRVRVGLWSPMTDDLIGPPTLGDQEIVDDRIGRHAPSARMDDWWTALRDASSNERITLSPLRSD